MPRRFLIACVAASLVLLVCCGAGLGAEKVGGTAPPPPPGVTLPQDVGKAFQVEAGKVKAQLTKEAAGLFRREPLGFDAGTLDRVSAWFLSLPALAPALVVGFSQDLRVLGVIGTLVILAFLGIIFYSLAGWKRVLTFLEKFAHPLREHLSDTWYPLVLSGLRILAATLIPLIILGFYSLIRELIAYDAPWFVLTGELLKLWALGALAINGLREVLLAGHLPIPPDNARPVYRTARLIILYILLGLALVMGAKVFAVPGDILALLNFAVSLSIVFASSILLLRKRAILGVLPDLPYKTYRVFCNGLGRLYYPALFLTFLSGLLWCAGYKSFTVFLWQKTWAVAGAFLLIMLGFHKARMLLNGWMARREPSDHLAGAVHRALHYLLIFTTLIIGMVVILRLLGLYAPLRGVISFPLVLIGERPISFWTLIKVGLTFTGFIFGSRLVRSYLDYKIYPLLGVDEGLAYSINILLSYLFIAIAAFFSLTMIGIDFRALMIFASAVGIGIGLGLQKIAANLISGLILIFGRKVRKGDWIKVGDTVGSVRHIGLSTTTVWTRDNIELMIPNNDLVAGTIVNYTLTSPEIRIHVPVGVSYSADPRNVANILVAVAENTDHVLKSRKPLVWFTEFGDSSINFELLVWIDVRRWSERAVRSHLYYRIFESLGRAGIEIPFPQRDVHIRSGAVSAVSAPGPGAEEKQDEPRPL